MNDVKFEYNENLHTISEEELLARIAWFYYHDNLTQSEIGDKLKLPRLKISRLLEKGRRQGIIKVQINSRFTGCLELEEALQQRFNLKHIRILPALERHETNERLGIGAAQMLMSLLKPNQILAIGFGETIMQTIKYCNEFITHNDIKLITLSGGVGPYMKGIGQLDGSCSVSIIPAPLRASSAEAATLFKRYHVGGLQCQCGHCRYRSHSPKRTSHITSHRLYYGRKTTNYSKSGSCRRYFGILHAKRRFASARYAIT